MVNVVIRCSVVLRTVAVPVVAFLKMPCSSDDSEKLVRRVRWKAFHGRAPIQPFSRANRSWCVLPHNANNVFDKLRPKNMYWCVQRSLHNKRAIIGIPHAHQKPDCTQYNRKEANRRGKHCTHSNMSKNDLAVLPSSWGLLWGYFELLLLLLKARSTYCEQLIMSHQRFSIKALTPNSQTVYPKEKHIHSEQRS